MIGSRRSAWRPLRGFVVLSVAVGAFAGCSAVMASNEMQNDFNSCADSLASQRAGEQDNPRPVVLSVLAKCLNDAGKGKVKCKAKAPDVRPGFPGNYECTAMADGAGFGSDLGEMLDGYLKDHPQLQVQ